MADFHPLFPPNEEDDEDADPPDIQLIQVLRKDNGKYVTSPITFIASDLNSTEKLFAEYGGGEYQLVGNDLRHILSRKVLLTLPGPSKPMFDPTVIEPPKVQAPTHNPMMSMMGGGEGGMMPLFMMMIQQMMASQQAASQQATQMMMAFIQSLTQGTAADKQAAQEAMNRQAERDAAAHRSNLELVTKLAEARQPGNSTGGEESFFKGVEFMKHFATQQVEMLKATAATGKGDGGFDLESLAGSLIEAFQGFKAFQGMAMSPEIPAPAEVVS